MEDPTTEIHGQDPLQAAHVFEECLDKMQHIKLIHLDDFVIYPRNGVSTRRVLYIVPRDPNNPDLNFRYLNSALYKPLSAVRDEGLSARFSYNRIPADKNIEFAVRKWVVVDDRQELDSGTESHYIYCPDIVIAKLHIALHDIVTATKLGITNTAVAYAFLEGLTYEIPLKLKKKLSSMGPEGRMRAYIDEIQRIHNSR